MTKQIGRWALVALLGYGLVSSGDVRRKAIGGIAEVVKLAAGGVTTVLARESARYDAERAGVMERTGQLQAAVDVARSDSEKRALNQELRDAEAEGVAVACDLGNVVRTGRIIEQAGDSIASAFSAKRGYASASRSALRGEVVAERGRSRAMAAELEEARALLAEAGAAGGAADKLDRAVGLIEDVNEKLARLREAGE